MSDCPVCGGRCRPLAEPPAYRPLSWPTQLACFLLVLGLAGAIACGEGLLRIARWCADLVPPPSG